MPGTMPPGGSTSKPDFRSRFLQSGHSWSVRAGKAMSMVSLCTWQAPVRPQAW